MKSPCSAHPYAAEACGETSNFLIRSSTLCIAASSSGLDALLGGARGQLSHFSCPQPLHVFAWSWKGLSHFSQFHTTGDVSSESPGYPLGYFNFLGLRKRLVRDELMGNREVLTDPLGISRNAYACNSRIGWLYRKTASGIRGKFGARAV